MEFTSDEIAGFRRSWEKSRVETQRFLRRVTALPAYDARKSVEIHEQQQLLEHLSSPLKEAKRWINANMRALSDREGTIVKATEAEKLNRALYMPLVSIANICLNAQESIISNKSRKKASFIRCAPFLSLTTISTRFSYRTS